LLDFNTAEAVVHTLPFLGVVGGWQYDEYLLSRVLGLKSPETLTPPSMGSDLMNGGGERGSRFTRLCTIRPPDIGTTLPSCGLVARAELGGAAGPGGAVSMRGRFGVTWDEIS
jgi:hypothetical protein